MNKSVRTRSILLAIGAALALPLATLAVAPPGVAATGVAVDDTGVAAVGDFASFGVVANDDGGNALANFDYEEIDAGADPAFSDGGDTISFDATSAVPGTYSVGYTLHDGNTSDPIGHAVLTIKVVTRDLLVDAGPTNVTFTWQNLPSDIDGVHISRSTSPIYAHNGTEITHLGTGPATFTGLTNGTHYYFYVTPYYGTTDLENGETPDATPRATNAAPVAVDDRLDLLDDNAASIYVVGNDSDADNDDLSVIGHSTPAHGTVSCESYGSCLYTPSGPRQNDSFTYTLSDSHGGRATGTVTVRARSVTTADDTANTYVDETTLVPVTSNDNGVLAGDTVQVTSNPACANGYADENNTVHVTGNVAGSCVIDYEVVTDSYQTLATGHINVTVGPKRPLVAADDEEWTTIGAPVDIDVTDNDLFTLSGTNNSFPLLEGAGNTELVSGPQHGTVTMDFQPRYIGPHDDARNVPVFTYTPDANYRGDDTFTYRLADGHTNTDTALVTVHNTADQPFGGNADAGIATAHLTWYNPHSPAFDDVAACYAVGTTRTAFPETPTLNPDGSCATGTAVSSLGSGTPASVDMTGLTNDRWYSVAVFAHYDDGNPGGVWSTGEEIDFRPGVQPAHLTWYDAGDGTTQSQFTWTNPGPSGTAVTWNAASSPTSPGNGTYQVFAAGLTTGLATIAAGTWHVGLFAKGPSTFADPDTVDINVAPGNHAPVANPDSLSVQRGRSKNVNVGANDTDADAGDLVEVKSWTQPAHGSVYCFVQTCTYTADEAAGNTTDSFTYTMGDHRFGTSTATVSITVGQNRPPVAYNDYLTRTTSVPSTYDFPSYIASDPDGNALTYSVPNPNANLGMACSTTGHCTLTPTVTGNYTVPYTVTDTHGASASANLYITVVDNQPPTTSDLDLDVDKDATTAVAVELAPNSHDPEGGALTYARTSQAQKGTASCNATTGHCTYLPKPGAVGEDSFTFSVKDSGGAFAYGTVLVTIHPFDNPPVATSFTTASTDNAHQLLFDLSGHATDADGDPLTYVVSQAPTSAMGTLSCDPDGSCTFTPNPSFTGNATFKFRANDGQKSSADATVTIPVTQYNYAPEATDDNATTHDTKPVTTKVLLNDTDANGDPFTPSLVDEPFHGTAVCSGSTCTYTPVSGYVGSDVYTYKDTDSHGGESNVAQVIVTVTADHPPVATNDAATTAYNVAKTVNVKANDTDADGDVLSYVKATNPLHGTATCTTAGSCTYTPNGTYAGKDTFTYTVSDGYGGSATGTVTMTVSQTAGSGTITLTGSTLRSVKLPIKLTGTMSPKVPGTKLTLQRKLSTATTWSNLTATATESSTGAYVLSYTQTTSGIYDYRVSSPSSGIRKAFFTPSKRVTLYSLSLPASSTTGNEYVTVKNTGTVAVNLLNWVLTTKTSPAKTFTLPSKALAAGASVRIHPGTGTTTATDLYLNKTSAAFGTHDTLSLKDLAKTVVATRTF